MNKRYNRLSINKQRKTRKKYRKTRKKYRKTRKSRKSRKNNRRKFSKKKGGADFIRTPDSDKRYTWMYNATTDTDEERWEYYSTADSVKLEEHFITNSNDTQIDIGNTYAVIKEQDKYKQIRIDDSRKRRLVIRCNDIYNCALEQKNESFGKGYGKTIPAIIDSTQSFPLVVKLRLMVLKDTLWRIFEGVDGMDNALTLYHKIKIASIKRGVHLVTDLGNTIFGGARLERGWFGVSVYFQCEICQSEIKKSRNSYSHNCNLCGMRVCNRCVSKQSRNTWLRNYSKFTNGYWIDCATASEYTDIVVGRGARAGNIKVCNKCLNYNVRIQDSIINHWETHGAYKIGGEERGKYTQYLEEGKMYEKQLCPC